MNVRRAFQQILIIGLTAMFLLPLVMTFLSSFMSEEELTVVYKNGTPFRWIPYRVTMEGYWNLLFASQTYLSTFWNSMLIVMAVVVLQVLVSLIMGYSLSRARFRGKSVLLFLYIVIMLTPFQVTLLPNYLLVRRMGLYNTWWALILPGVFAPLGVFLMWQFVKEIPSEMIEAMHMETSSNLRVIVQLVAPNVKAGLLTVAILAFAENWNMVEQPLILIEDQWLYPLSIRLNALGGSALDIRFPGAVLYMIPAVLLYFIFENEIVDGVRHMKL